jgi:hypothetical protein
MVAGAAGSFRANGEAMRDGVSAARLLMTDQTKRPETADMTDAGKPAFPNSEILVPRAEWAYWADEGNGSWASDALKPNFANVKRVFDAIGKNATQLKAGHEVASGV